MKSFLLFLFMVIGTFSVVHASDIEAAPLPFEQEAFMLNPHIKSEIIEKNKFQKSKGRRPSAYVPNVSDDVPQDLTQFTNEVLKVTSSDQLHEVILKYEKILTEQQASNDLRFVMTHFTRMKVFRGIIYRMVPLVKDYKFLHSQILTVFMSISKTLSIYLPPTHVRSIFNYLTEPYIGIQPFRDTNDFQRFLGNDVYKSGIEASNALMRLISSPPATVKTMINETAFPYINRNYISYWDRKLIFGPVSMSDGLRQVNTVTTEEILAEVSVIHRGLHDLATFVAYDFDDFFGVIANIGKKFGLDAAMSFSAYGVPDSERIEAIKSEVKGKKSTLGFGANRREWRLKDKVGKSWMAVAYKNLIQSAVARRWAMDIAKEKGSSSEIGIFNFANFAATGNNEAVITATNETIEKFFDHRPVDLRSPITGEVVQVDLYGFYSNPPETFIELLPEGYNTNAPKFLKKAGIQYRNYEYGKATHWNAEAYKKLWPKIGKDGTSVPRNNRIMAESWGGWFVRTPMLILRQ